MRRLVFAALLAAALALPASAAAAPPVAEAARSCSVGDGRGYGTTYVTSLRVSGTSCRSGKRVVRAFHACRPGRRGKCRRRVRGYRCREGERVRGVGQYDSRVTCRNSGNVVKHRYTQNT